jgi:hypothetical protein
MKRPAICVLFVAAISLFGCAPIIPVVAATSYVTGQVTAAFLPDSIKMPVR